jgi:hypothetical protein
LTLESGNWDPGWVKHQDSELNNLDHISESLNNNFFGLKYLNSLIQIRDPEWKKFGSGIRDKHPGSAILQCAPFTIKGRQQHILASNE